MNKPEPDAVYNARIPKMKGFSPRWIRRSALPLLLCLYAFQNSFAGDWTAAEQQLAKKIASAIGPGTVALEVTNRSSLGPKDGDQITRELRAQLATLGLRLAATDQAAAVAQVTLSEDAQGYVWVAKIHVGTNDPVMVIVNAPRQGAVAFARDASPLTLRKTALWSQELRILDVAVFEEMSGMSRLVVLDGEKAALYRFQEGRWQLEQAMPIQHTKPWPRDLRARIVLRQDHLFDAYLPGLFCQASSTTPLALACRDSDDPWPLSGEPALAAFFAPTRNFFTGVLSPGVGKQTSTNKFYSAAAIPRSNYTLWLFAGVDGTTQLLDGVSEQTSRLNWGSDIAAVKTSCGSGTQVLATQSEGAGTDSIRAYEFPDRDPVPVSQSVDLPGAITALWTETKASSAVAITHNLDTGDYEAFRLSIACGQ